MENIFHLEKLVVWEEICICKYVNAFIHEMFYENVHVAEFKYRLLNMFYVNLLSKQNNVQIKVRCIYAILNIQM